MRVAVIDIGKPRTNLGWAIDEPADCGMDIDECVKALALAIGEGPLALGFEAPMFVPIREDPSTLTKARLGESGPGMRTAAFSAGAGASALVTGLVVVPYILRALRKRFGAEELNATFDPRALPTKSRYVFFFEAFVTGHGNTGACRHVRDAQLAIEELRRQMALPGPLKSAVLEATSMNLLGAMLLRAEWTTDLGVLSAPCLVVKPSPRASVGQTRI